MEVSHTGCCSEGGSFCLCLCSPKAAHDKSEFHAITVSQTLNQTPLRMVCFLSFERLWDLTSLGWASPSGCSRQLNLTAVG